MRFLFCVLIAFLSLAPLQAMTDWESYKGNEGDYRLVADTGGNSGIAFVCYDNRLFLSLMQAKVLTQRPTKPIPVFLSVSVDGGSEKLFDAYLMGFDVGACRQVYMPYNSTVEHRRYAFGEPLVFSAWKP